jgi:hypothetical protein
MQKMLENVSKKRGIARILFVFICILFSGYTAGAGIVYKNYDYTTGKNPAVASSKYSGYFLEVHEVRGDYNMYYTVLDENHVIARPSKLPGSGYDLSVAYIAKNSASRQNENFAVVYCAKYKQAIDTSLASGVPSSEIYMITVNPYTRVVSRPKLIVGGTVNFHPSVAFITSGKYDGCLAIVFVKKPNSILNLCVITLDGRRKLTVSLDQKGKNPSITFIENGDLKGCLAEVHEHQDEKNKGLFMNIINLENLSNKDCEIKNEITGLSGLGAGKYYDDGENPTVAGYIDYSREPLECLLIEAHNAVNSNRLNMNVYKLSRAGVQKTAEYKEYSHGYKVFLTYGRLGLADVHMGKTKSNLWLNLIRLPRLFSENSSKPDPRSERD